MFGISGPSTVWDHDFGMCGCALNSKPPTWTTQTRQLLGDSLQSTVSNRLRPSHLSSLRIRMDLIWYNPQNGQGYLPASFPYTSLPVFFSFVRKKLIYKWNAKRPRYSPNIQIPSLLTWRWLQWRIGRLWTPLSIGKRPESSYTQRHGLASPKFIDIFYDSTRVFFLVAEFFGSCGFLQEDGFSPMNYIIECVLRGLAP